MAGSRHRASHTTGDDPARGDALDLDDLLELLIARAGDVLAGREHLRGLLDATQLIIGDLELPVVLRHIVEAACALVGARYGALGVLAAGGQGLQQFVTVGIDDATIDLIGRPPTGKGVLGAIIDDPRPIRLADLRDDPRSMGFPEHHPPMRSFLGVPIRVRDKVFGNLYLTESANGTFSREDEQIVVALATTAGVAIENARLYEQSARKQAWLEASARISRELLLGAGPDPLMLIAQLSKDLADADVVSVVLPSNDPERLLVEVAAGVGAEELVGLTYPRRNTLAGSAIGDNRPILLENAKLPDTVPLHQTDVLDVGSAMAAPLTGPSRVRGALVFGRAVGRTAFEAADIDMATSFANQATLALELADAQAMQFRIGLMEDRDRIARDLHDHVIQRLFAAGLTLEGLTNLSTQARADRIGDVVMELDDVIRRIRSSIFELTGPAVRGAEGLRATVQSVVHDLEGALLFHPQVTFVGPVDTVASPTVADDVEAVLREALTNVVRHARATHVAVRLSASGGHVELEVLDNGVGVDSPDRRSGLANIDVRAQKYGGSVELESPVLDRTQLTDTPGTRLLWTIPIP